MPNMTANPPAMPAARGRNRASWKSSWQAAGGAAAVLAVAGSLAACQTFSSYVSLRAAFKPSPASKVQPVTPPGSPAMKLYAGDSNFHIKPEASFRLRKDLRKVVDTIQQSHLDFVFYTPTVKSRFYEKEGGIEEAVQQWKDLRQYLETVPDPKPLFLPGLEYQDKTNGSVSLLFLDLPTVFTELKARDFRNSPPLFFYTAKAFGALISINTPLASPISVPVESYREKYASTDRSWRPFTESGRGLSYFPPEIQAAHELSYGVEAYSLPVAVWRDQYVLGDPLISVRDIMRLMDKLILEKRRRMVPLSGSDSLGGILHPMMFIAATSRTPQALREGLLRGRVCIRAPEPCALRAYADDDAIPQGVGAALRARQRVEFHWKGEGELLKNGESVGNFDSHATVAADSQCSVYRLVLDGGFSAPIYVNCPWAEIELQL